MTDEKEFKQTTLDPEERKARAQRIFDAYISPNSGGSMVIYTSEAQRKAIAAGMKHLWGKSKKKRKTDESPTHRRQTSGNFSSRHGGETGDCKAAAGSSSGHAENQVHRGEGLRSDVDDGEKRRHWDSEQHPERGGGAERPVEEDDSDGKGERRQQSPSGRRNPPDFAMSDSDVHGVPGNGCDNDGGGGGKNARREEQDPDCTDYERSARTDTRESNVSSRGSQVSVTWNEASAPAHRPYLASGASDAVGMGGENSEEAGDLQRALSLFDEVLDQNAIPTIRQHSEFQSHHFFFIVCSLKTLHRPRQCSLGRRDFSSRPVSNMHTTSGRLQEA